MMADRRMQRIRERAYTIWEEAGRKSENDLAHWLQAEVEVPLRVTFDSNAYRQAVDPCRARRDASLYHLQKINDALKGGRVLGYLAQTLVTLEGIEKKDRVDVLGSTRLESRSEVIDEAAINISIGVRQDRKPINPILFDWIQAAQNIGLRFLRTGSRWFDGSGHLTKGDYKFFEPDQSVLELAERMDKINDVTRAIQARGLGYAAAVSVGLEFSARDDATGEWWLQGLRRARNDTERSKVIKSVAEWADADSIAAHIGYELDVFCTRDTGNSTGGMPSILDKENRSWVTGKYGVMFVTLTELAEMI